MRMLRALLIIAISAAMSAACSGPGMLDEPFGAETVTGDSLAVVDSTRIDSASAISVAEAQSMYVDGDALPVVVRGYIVGTVKSSFATGCNFDAPFTVETNLLLADSRNPYDKSICIPVELIKGRTIRDSLNLVSNPDMFGAKVAICGVLERYFKVAGIKSATAFAVLEKP